MYRLALLLAVALPLAVADLAVKARVPTEPWAFHERSFPWLVLSVSLFAVLVAATRIPSILVAAAAGVLAGGLLGNSLSAAWNDMRVPNPLLLSAPRSVVAFNLADLWVVGGIVLLVLALGSWLIANRELLPPPAEVRATRGRAFGRLFQRS